MFSKPGGIIVLSQAQLYEDKKYTNIKNKEIYSL
jgi:hypothetical protein